MFGRPSGASSACGSHVPPREPVGPVPSSAALRQAAPSSTLLYPMPLDRGAIPVLEVGTIVEALRQHLGGTHDYALHCPRAAPSVGVVACTYHHWFRPFSQHRRYCQLPVSGRRMQRFLQFRLGSHQLPIVLGRFAGAVRASRVCTHCGSVAVADELHMIFECPALQAVRQRYASLFSANTDTMRSFFAQQDHMQVFKFVLDCLDVFQI